MSNTGTMDRSEIPAPPKGFQSPWRIAKGQILRGREEDGTLESIDNLEGDLLWTTIHEGIGDDGSEYQYVKACLRLRDGSEERIHTSTTSKSATATFVSALLQCQPGDFISITARLGSKEVGVGSKKSKPTYVNIQKWDGKSWVKIATPYSEDYDGLVQSLRDAPHYKEIEKDSDNGGDAEGGFAEFYALCDEKQWPEPKGGNEPEYCQMIEKLLKLKAGSLPVLSDVSETDWTSIVKACAAAKQMPAILAKCPNQYDPFADE